jgi:hypothetical protein
MTAPTITHAFVSAIADGADTTLVRPGNWNAGHTLGTMTPGFLGNCTGSPLAPDVMTQTVTTAFLNAVVGDSGSGGTKGMVPAPGAGDAAAGKYLKADGTWQLLTVGTGANGRAGLATLIGGAKVVSNTSVTASTLIQLTVQTLGTVTVPTAVAATARSNGSSFTITSANVVDTSVVAWLLIEPA